MVFCWLLRFLEEEEDDDAERGVVLEISSGSSSSSSLEGVPVNTVVNSSTIVVNMFRFMGNKSSTSLVE